jgi:hypothetical protein
MVSDVTENLLRQLIAVAPELAAAYDEILKQWQPDSPPPIVAFGKIGLRIADDFDIMSSKTIDSIFDLIETGMKSGDDELLAAVATGLIEAMVGQAERSEAKLDRMRSRLGTLSKSHADAWIGFGSNNASPN